MKHFIKSLTGKTILFVSCIISTVVLLVSLFGIVLYTNNYGRFYFVAEDEMINEIITDYSLIGYGNSILYREIGSNTKYNGDFEYQIKDLNGDVVSKTKNYIDGKALYHVSYDVIREDGEIAAIFHQNDFDEPSEENYSLSLYPIEGSIVDKELSFFKVVFHVVYSLRYAVYAIALVSLLLLVICFIALMYSSGKRSNSEEIHRTILNRLPYDLLSFICFFIVCCLFALADEATNNGFDIGTIVVCFTILFITGLSVFLGFCMETAARIKQGSLFRNTIIYHVFVIVCRIFKKSCLFIKKCVSFLFSDLSLLRKTVLTLFVVFVVEMIWLTVANGDRYALLSLWVVERPIIIVGVLYMAIVLNRLLKGGVALANGDLSYKIDTKNMFGDFKKHGEDLNNIAKGMMIAVEEKLKSEKMKTELITNVSHDIKTPLTSIINYAGLISKKSKNKSISEYSEVLVRQSEKLKRLLEDLIEVSKATTGNLEVETTPCDAGVFLDQIVGEYEEKLKENDLDLIIKQPQKQLFIMADGRRMWRVFDNLLNNICKYSQAGTRVYLSLEEIDNKAVFSFKNTSKEALDMSEEELLERFTRGDSSRNTSGNGLGLSIAKSLVELQGGSLSLVSDGDLFKVVISFDLI